MKTLGNLIISGSLTTTGSNNCFSHNLQVGGYVSASTFCGDGSNLTGITSYTESDVIQVLNTKNVISQSQAEVSLSGSFSGSFYGDGTNLSGVTSYTDADTLDYINTLNIISSSAQIAEDISGAFDEVSASFDTRINGISTNFDDITGKPTLVSGSSQISYPAISDIPAGIISSSTQIAEDISGAFDEVSASFDTRINGISTNFDDITGKPPLLSSSIQIEADISGAFTSVSESISTNITQLSQSIATEFGSISTNFDDITGKPTLVSQSSQISYPAISDIPAGIISGANQLANQTIDGNLTVSGTLTAREFHTEFVSASIIYQSGSTQFGNSNDDVHNFSGSINPNLGTSKVLVTGVSGYISASNITTTDLSYLDGVSSNIQTQLNSKQDSLTFGTGSGNAICVNDNDISDGDIPIFTSIGLEGRPIAGFRDYIGLATNGDVKFGSVTAGSVTACIKATNGVVSSSAQIDSLGFLQVDGDSVVSSSAQIIGILSPLNNFTSSIDATIKNKLDTEEVISGSGATVQFAAVGVATGSDGTYALKVSGSIGATGDIVAAITSDERLKDCIQLIDHPIQKVQSLRGVTWCWNPSASLAAQNTPTVGLIAQDVQKVLPQLVCERDGGYLALDYPKVVGLLVEAIKDLQQQIDDIKNT